MAGFDPRAVVDDPVDGAGVALRAGPDLADDVAVVGGFERALLGDRDDERLALDGVQQNVGAGGVGAEEEVPPGTGRRCEQAEQRPTATGTSCCRRDRGTASCRCAILAMSPTWLGAWSRSPGWLPERREVRSWLSGRLKYSSLHTPRSSSVHLLEVQVQLHPGSLVRYPDLVQRVLGLHQVTLGLQHLLSQGGGAARVAGSTGAGGASRIAWALSTCE